MMTISASHIHKKFVDEVLKEIVKGNIKNREDLLHFKKLLASKYNLKRVPSNAEILSMLPECEREEKRYLFIRKPVRTISGVAVIAVMTSPHPCPHGRCVPCPGGPPRSPQSYTGREPASMRAERNYFDPYLQTRERLGQLEAIGHATDKIDLIIMGGTFMARDFHYQEWFIKRCYDALNGREAKSLEEAKRMNEESRNRCVGLTIETRPDWCGLQHVDRMLEYGATRVEIGVQILDDKVLYEIKRGHTVTDVINATRIAKDAGLKVCYHIMPGLPGSSFDNDLSSFKKMFSDERFMPDMLKIYPTLVVKPSELYEKWKRGEYRAIEEDEMVELIAEMKKCVPEWVRIQRIERDIPSHLIQGGIKKSNLRQIVHSRMEEMGWKCRCIRCREVGHRWYKDGLNVVEGEIYRREYRASGGKEIFLSIEDKEKDVIIAYCRLRIPAKPHRYEIDSKCGIVRELKVHGPVVRIGRKPMGEWQHRGYGRMLIEEAEHVARKYGMEKIAVLSGVGAKGYYRKIGYRDDGVYMSKELGLS